MDAWTPIIGNVIVAIVALIGSVYGTKKSNDENSKVILYRIEQLEKKQDKYNNLVERTFKLEESEKILSFRVDGLEEEIKDE